MKYLKYFSSFSYFAIYVLGEWNNSKIWKTRKILANIARDNLRYRISSDKRRASYKRRPLTAAPLGIHIEVSASLY